MICNLLTFPLITSNFTICRIANNFHENHQLMVQMRGDNHKGQPSLLSLQILNFSIHIKERKFSLHNGRKISVTHYQIKSQLLHHIWIIRFVQKTLIHNFHNPNNNTTQPNNSNNTTHPEHCSWVVHENDFANPTQPHHHPTI